MFLPFFLFAGIHHSWAWRRWSLNRNQILWTPLLCSALVHCTLPNRSQRSKGLFSWSPGNELAVNLPPSYESLECHIPWSAALEHHIPHHHILAGENMIQYSTSPCWLLSHLEKESILSAFQETPGFLTPCCVIPPIDIAVFGVLYEDQGLWMWGWFYLSSEGFVNLIFLVRWPSANPHHNVTCPCPPFNPDS